MEKEELVRKKIIKQFKNYCSVCKLCCGSGEIGEVNFFKSEFKKLPRLNECVYRRNFGENKCIIRLNIKKGCPYANQKGCSLRIDLRPLDCMSFPVYPIFKYSNGNKSKEIIGLMIHKSCPFAKNISNNDEILKQILNLWQIEEKKYNNQQVKEWFGDKRNYWLDKNIIKIKL